jgi:hypothetical protein
MDTPKYGVMLVSYDGQPFNMWVSEDGKRIETASNAEAWEVQKRYTKRNPKGWYQVKEIEETKS